MPTYIGSILQKITFVGSQFRSATSENLIQTMGGSINGLIDKVATQQTISLMNGGNPFTYSVAVSPTSAANGQTPAGGVPGVFPSSSSGGSDPVVSGPIELDITGGTFRLAQYHFSQVSGGTFAPGSLSSVFDTGIAVAANRFAFVYTEFVPASAPASTYLPPNAAYLDSFVFKIYVYQVV